jgi:hypothetical protein
MVCPLPFLFIAVAQITHLIGHIALGYVVEAKACWVDIPNVDNPQMDKTSLSVTIHVAFSTTLDHVSKRGLAMCSLVYILMVSDKEGVMNFLNFLVLLHACTGASIPNLSFSVDFLPCQPLPERSPVIVCGDAMPHCALGVKSVVPPLVSLHILELASLPQFTPIYWIIQYKEELLLLLGLIITVFRV